MTKKELKDILAKYKVAEREVMELDSRYGICLYNSRNENFYNKYNWIIFRLIESIFGYKGKELIENYIFGEIEMNFDELCENLGIYE